VAEVLAGVAAVARVLQVNGVIMLAW